ncbi:hypothetical protein AI2870V1_5231 (plasmid) [Klebsiella pneumoniae]|nr:hypothetical protein AI2870V1_5231 [Klebsiella pneumoniae]CAH5573830.1 hypothetical protein AI2870V1_5231 [Klebsiella pneumoniae]
MNGITNIFLRGVGIMSKMFALLLLSAWLRPCAAQGNELVMATTFSPSATVWIIEKPFVTSKARHTALAYAKVVPTVQSDSTSSY